MFLFLKAGISLLFIKYFCWSFLIFSNFNTGIACLNFSFFVEMVWLFFRWLLLLYFLIFLLFILSFDLFKKLFLNLLLETIFLLSELTDIYDSSELPFFFFFLYLFLFFFFLLFLFSSFSSFSSSILLELPSFLSLFLFLVSCTPVNFVVK